MYVPYLFYLHLSRYNDAMREYLEESAALDPRFKSLPWLSDSQRESVYIRILRLIFAVLKKANSEEQDFPVVLSEGDSNVNAVCGATVDGATSSHHLFSASTSK